MSDRNACSRGRLTVAVTLVLTLVLLGFVSPFASAQDAVAKGPPTLGLGYGRTSGLESAPARPERVPPEWRQHPQYRPYQTAYPYYISPWGWYIPQTYSHKYYPPPVALEPRLGLLYNYPYAWQMGLQLPYDSDPLYTYSLGPYRGVVRSPQEPQWLHETVGTGPLGLMREGRFREAGRVLAEEFRTSDDPAPPLLLAEALFALEKYRHAELVLRHALELEDALESLPDEVASHFPSPADFEKRVKALVAVDVKAPLLKAYLLLFTEEASSGLDRLAAMMAENPKDAIPGQLYRHFLGKAFGKAEMEAPEKK